MIVPEEVKSAWGGLLEHGDYEKIAEQADKSYATISNAVRTGKCSESTFIAINNYLAAKKNRIEKSSKKVIE